VAPQIIKGLQGVVDAMKAGGMPEVERTHSVRKIPLSPQFKPAEIAAIRMEIGFRQPEFAQFLGVSLSELRDWENATGSPIGAASRLLDAMRCDPDYWRARVAANLTS
jgi:DNA-binding transcriptional regulator YiaG